MKQIKFLTILTIIISISIFYLSPKAMAQEDGQLITTTTVSSNTGTSSALKVERVRKKLAGEEISACQLKEKDIKMRLWYASSYLSTKIVVLERIVNGLDAYYKERTSFGINVSIKNYDELLSNINSKISVAKASLKKLEGDAGVFSCTSEGPVASLEEFRENITEAKSTMKECKELIKELIVSVKNITGKN